MGLLWYYVAKPAQAGLPTNEAKPDPYHWNMYAVLTVEEEVKRLRAKFCGTICLKMLVSEHHHEAGRRSLFIYLMRTCCFLPFVVELKEI